MPHQEWCIKVCGRVLNSSFYTEVQALCNAHSSPGFPVTQKGKAWYLLLLSASYSLHPFNLTNPCDLLGWFSLFLPKDNMGIWTSLQQVPPIPEADDQSFKVHHSSNMPPVTRHHQLSLVLLLATIRFLQLFSSLFVAE